MPKAYVVLAEGWAAGAETARAILEHARDHLAPYLKVRRVEFFELPKTISGKIRRVELRRREEDAHAAGTPIETEYRYEDLVDWPHEVLRRRSDRLRRSSRETIGANFERDRGDAPGHRGAGRRRRGRRWTYAELNAEVDVVARGLMAAAASSG